MLLPVYMATNITSGLTGMFRAIWLAYSNVDQEEPVTETEQGTASTGVRTLTFSEAALAGFMVGCYADISPGATNPTESANLTAVYETAYSSVYRHGNEISSVTESVTWNPGENPGNTTYFCAASINPLQPSGSVGRTPFINI